MLRVVLDTNILVSATIEPAGASSQILKAWRDGRIDLVTSPVLLAEFREVLERPRIQKYQRLSRQEISALVEGLAKAAIQTSGKLIAEVVHEDPADDYVISAALEGSANYIVTGNLHLLKLNPFQRIEIIKPSEMLSVLGRRLV